MEDEKEAVLDDENSDKSAETDEEDLLYTHKPESQDSSMRWNSTLCRKPGR